MQKDQQNDTKQPQNQNILSSFFTQSFSLFQTLWNPLFQQPDKPNEKVPTKEETSPKPENNTSSLEAKTNVASNETQEQQQKKKKKKKNKKKKKMASPRGNDETNYYECIDWAQAEEILFDNEPNKKSTTEITNKSQKTQVTEQTTSTTANKAEQPISVSRIINKESKPVVNTSKNEKQEKTPPPKKYNTKKNTCLNDTSSLMSYWKLSNGKYNIDDIPPRQRARFIEMNRKIQEGKKDPKRIKNNYGNENTRFLFNQDLKTGKQAKTQTNNGQRSENDDQGHDEFGTTSKLHFFKK